MSRFSVDKPIVGLRHDGYVDLVEGFEYKTHVGAPIDGLEILIDDEGNRLPPVAKIRDFSKNDFIFDYNVLEIEPFRTDLATLPWWITWWLKKLGKHNLPSIVHDYMLQHRELFPQYTRKMIDQVWREALIDQGVSKRKCQALYKGVRLNSWFREERFL